MFGKKVRTDIVILFQTVLLTANQKLYHCFSTRSGVVFCDPRSYLEQCKRSGYSEQFGTGIL